MGTAQASNLAHPKPPPDDPSSHPPPYQPPPTQRNSTNPAPQSTQQLPERQLAALARERRRRRETEGEGDYGEGDFQTCAQTPSDELSSLSHRTSRHSPPPPPPASPLVFTRPQFSATSPSPPSSIPSSIPSVADLLLTSSLRQRRGPSHDRNLSPVVPKVFTSELDSRPSPVTIHTVRLHRARQHST